MPSDPIADPARELDTLVEQVRAALDGQLSAVPDGPFVGTALEGRVRAEVGADGRLRGLDLDPKVLREPLADVAAHIVRAVNAALDELPGRPATAALAARLQQVQEESVAQMSRITQAFAAALARAGTR